MHKNQEPRTNEKHYDIKNVFEELTTKYGFEECL